MSVADFRRPSIVVDRHTTASGKLRYGLVVNRHEVCLSAHEPFDGPGELMIGTYNERGDWRPMRLTPREVAALRDALDLFLEDHPAS